LLTRIGNGNNWQKSRKDRIAKYYDSDKPELLVLCGRRSAGKTFLIKEFLAMISLYIIRGLPACATVRTWPITIKQL
jgi:tRNA A37 threonylcarbamoyladenosine biosynthesis protein TsaE